MLHHPLKVGQETKKWLSRIYNEVMHTASAAQSRNSTWLYSYSPYLFEVKKKIPRQICLNNCPSTQKEKLITIFLHYGQKLAHLWKKLIIKIQQLVFAGESSVLVVKYNNFDHQFHQYSKAELYRNLTGIILTNSNVMWNTRVQC